MQQMLVMANSDSPQNKRPFPTISHGGVSQSYLGAQAGLAFPVLLVAGPFVQLAPESLGPPGGELGLQAAVEGLMVQRVHI